MNKAASCAFPPTAKSSAQLNYLPLLWPVGATRAYPCTVFRVGSLHPQIILRKLLLGVAVRGVAWFTLCVDSFEPLQGMSVCVASV